MENLWSKLTDAEKNESFVATALLIDAFKDFKKYESKQTLDVVKKIR
jgi:hypothetical protein